MRSLHASKAGTVIDVTPSTSSVYCVSSVHGCSTVFTHSFRFLYTFENVNVTFLYSFRISMEDATSLEVGSHATASARIHITRSPTLWPAPENSIS